MMEGPGRDGLELERLKRCENCLCNRKFNSLYNSSINSESRMGDIWKGECV